MRKRRSPIDRAIEILEDEIRVRNAAIGALLVQRGDDVVPPRVEPVRARRTRPRPSTGPLVDEEPRP